MLLNLPIFSFGVSSLGVFGFAALCIALFAILRLRWWLSPLLVILSLGAICLLLFFTEQLRSSIDYIIAFGGWLFGGTPEHDYFGTGFEMVFLTYAMIFVVTLAMFLLVRRFISLWIFPALFLCAVFLFLLYDTTRLLPVLPISLFVATCVILLPRSYRRGVKRKSNVEGTLTGVEFIAIPVATIIVFIGVIITPQSNSHIVWRPLANTIQDVTHFLGFTSGEVSSDFDINRFGFGHSDGRLGGPVTLSDGYVLTVVSERPVLLAGAVKGYYTGYTWLPSRVDRPMRFNSFLWRAERENIFGLNMPFLDLPLDQLGADGAYWEHTDLTTIEITYASEHFATLFSPAGMRDISFSSSRLNNEIFFNTRSELHMMDSVPQGEVITINANLFDWNTTYFKEIMLHKEDHTSYDPFFDDIFERYTVLPTTLPDYVRETALAVAGDAPTPFLQAYALAHWLGDNFNYSIDTVIPPEDIDFVAHFLDTREGSCTYFATAMAVMARAVGLPSRYVTGFALVRDSTRENIFYATGRTAHAWTEIYFYGVGWIEFDPLRWNDNITLHTPAYSDELWAMWEEEWADLQAYLDALEAVTGYGQTEPQVVTDADRNVTPMYIFAIATASLLGVTLLIILLLYIKRKKYASLNINRKIPDPTERFSFYFKDIIGQLRIMGMELNPGETLTLFNQRIESRIRHYNSADATLHMVTATQIRLHFANITPSNDDVDTARKLHIILEGILKKELLPLSYLWRRVLLR